MCLTARLTKRWNSSALKLERGRIFLSAILVRELCENIAEIMQKLTRVLSKKQSERNDFRTIPARWSSRYKHADPPCVDTRREGTEQTIFVWFPSLPSRALMCKRRSLPEHKSLKFSKKRVLVYAEYRRLSTVSGNLFAATSSAWIQEIGSKALEKGLVKWQTAWIKLESTH